MSASKSSPARIKSKKATKASTAKRKKTSKAKSQSLPKAEVVEVPAVAEPFVDKAPAVTDEQISQRAYEIWIEKGRPYGQEQANWDQAVAELRG